jgi:hypothetical protein
MISSTAHSKLMAFSGSSGIWAPLAVVRLSAYCNKRNTVLKAAQESASRRSLCYVLAS